MLQHLRIARPVTDIARSVRMYLEGLGWSLLDEFTDHNGFDGVIIGLEASPCHFEFTKKRNGHIIPAPTAEDLVVLYMPVASEWRRTCESMASVGFAEVAPFNPYWAVHGKTFQDPDGYRLVLQNASWPDG